MQLHISSSKSSVSTKRRAMLTVWYTRHWLSSVGPLKIPYVSDDTELSSYVFPAVLSFALLVATFVFALRSLRNFGLGLKQHRELELRLKCCLCRTKPSTSFFVENSVNRHKTPKEPANSLESLKQFKLEQQYELVSLTSLLPLYDCQGIGNWYTHTHCRQILKIRKHFIECQLIDL